MADNKEIETTGHKWDDEEGYPLTEYNNPLPKWWLYSYYATIIFAVVYWVLYPAWPTPNGFTKGILGWTQYGQLKEEMEEGQKARKVFEEKLSSLTSQEISQDSQLLQFAISGGKTIFGDNCAPCHGNSGIGSKVGGFPTLVDDDWLFGGTLENITTTIKYGRKGQMPAHLEANGGSFSQAQVSDLTQYALSLSGRASDNAAVTRGDELYHGEASCNSCHGDHGKGSLIGKADGEPIDNSIGAPNLSDAIWLYGSDPATVEASIAKGRTGEMPSWAEDSDRAGRKLNDLAIKQVSIYVHSLGGGQ
ncbi:MAG: cytochrome-c oxidase, cbb3-type subunit III [Magnetococcales bacterium]|nr:cytochrome-c oxidase, cbb3-type subunit III [Magnetococcales bacterium]